MVTEGFTGAVEGTRPHRGGGGTSWEAPPPPQLGGSGFSPPCLVSEELPEPCVCLTLRVRGQVRGKRWRTCRRSSYSQVPRTVLALVKEGRTVSMWLHDRNRGGGAFTKQDTRAYYVTQHR